MHTAILQRTQFCRMRELDKAVNGTQGGRALLTAIEHDQRFSKLNDHAVVYHKRDQQTRLMTLRNGPPTSRNASLLA